MTRLFKTFILLFAFLSSSVAFAGNQHLPPTELIGPGVKLYTYTDNPPKDDTIGVDVPFPKEYRMVNISGNCVWISLSMLGRWAQIDDLYKIAEPISKGGDSHCQGGSYFGAVQDYCAARRIRIDYTTTKDDAFMEKYCKIERRGVGIFVPHHSVNIFGYSIAERKVVVFDNADRSQTLHTMDWDKFHRWWDGTAYAIFRDPDLVPYRFNPWVLIPVDDHRSNPLTMPKEYFPLPSNN